MNSSVNNVDNQYHELVVTTQAKDSIDMRHSPYVLMSCFIAGICFFNTNYNFSITNIPNKVMHVCPDNKYKDEVLFSGCIPMSDYYFGLFNSIISLGGLLGSLLAIYTSFKLGRKPALLYLNLGFIIGGSLIFLFSNKHIFVFGRFIVGLACGMAQSLSPLYAAEISTILNRGAMGLLQPILGDIGNITGLLISYLLNDFYYWRYLFLISVVLGIIQPLLGYLFLVETPRFLLLFKKDECKARINLQKLRKGKSTEIEYEQIMSNLSNTDNEDYLNIESDQLKALRLLVSSLYRTRFLIVLAVLLGQGLSGIAITDYYSQEILQTFYTPEVASMYVIWSMIGGIVASIGTTLLVDRMGRKAFLILSEIGMCVGFVLLSVGKIYTSGYAVIIGIFCIKIMYGLGLSGIPFVVAAEFFPTYLVSGGNGIVVSMCWFGHFIVVWSFEYLKSLLSIDYVFLVYVFINLGLAAFTLFLLPETKRKSLEEIDSMFNSTNYNKSKTTEIENYH